MSSRVGRSRRSDFIKFGAAARDWQWERRMRIDFIGGAWAKW